MAEPPLRAINFSAGPAALPLAALEQARDELLNFAGSGASVMELSHRGPEYEAVHSEALASLRALGGIPDTHEILLLQGGASQHFAQLAMNFLPAGGVGGYVLTGGWSDKAYEEAERVASLLGATARVVASTRREDGRYTRIPAQGELALDRALSYVHITTNNTLFGTQWHHAPELGQLSLIADQSSDFFWAPRDFSRYAFVYAGAQKNLGPSGLVVVVADKRFLEQGNAKLPVIFRYQTHAEHRSLFHTPPTFAIYMLRNVLRWTAAQGGLAAMEQRNRAKAAAVYGALERWPALYSVPAELGSRSTMNVVWRMPTPELEARFLAEARKRNMLGLKGHRSVGGLRASLYNAVEPAHAEALAALLDEFARSATP